MTRSKDPQVVIVAKTIIDFNWGNYGLDEVGYVEDVYADFAWELAAEIVGKLGGQS